MDEMPDEASEGPVAGPPEKNVFDSLTNGEKVLGVAAAWLFLINYVLGNRITDDYYGTVVVWVSMLALGILTAIYFYHFGKDAAWHALYPWMARVAAWGIVVLAVLDLLNGILHEFSTSGRFYEITFYIAAAVMGAALYLMRQEGLDD
jgi:hypothetical protein